MPQVAVDHAKELWQERLRHGIVMPNNETAVIALDDLYHVIVDPRIWRHLERIELMLVEIFQIRSAKYGRRIALTRWEENNQQLVGYVILEAGNRLWSVHVVDEKRLRREERRGNLLWKR